jgi:hypothetical protein
LTRSYIQSQLKYMSDDNSNCSQCGVPLEPAVAQLDAQLPLCVGCAEEAPPPPGPDLRSWLLFGALVSGSPDDAGDQ